MKIAIAGYGIEGESNYQYWNKDGNDVVIVDEKEQPTTPIPDGATTMLGSGVFERLGEFDLVIRTAGLSPAKVKTTGKVWSSTNEFLEQCPAQIIGVTGTKGKGTTSSLIASMLKASGKKTWLVGNIGVAPLSVLSQISPEDIVVMEMSSFQLWDSVRSPHIAVVLGIEPDHLDAHSSFEDYLNAKANIRRFQNDNDVCFYHYGNENSYLTANASQKGKKLKYAIKEQGSVYFENGAFMIDDKVICHREDLRLLGNHNVENACAAISVALEYGISNQDITKGLESFEGLPHRLEFVRNLDGADYYNDSFSSNPSATVAAILSFEKPIVLIVGGRDKGADFSHLMETCKTHSNQISTVISIGESKNMLAEMFKQQASDVSIKVSDANNMNEIIADARAAARPGDIVLLSPACASFDMFKDFYQRGDLFRSIVQSL